MFGSPKDPTTNSTQSPRQYEPTPIQWDVPEVTRKSTLSFELTFLELFDGFTSQRVAGCLYAALKRQINETGNKYRESYTYFKL